MPAKGKSKLTLAQKAAIAAGKAAGKRRADIARIAGVSESSVSHAAARPDVRTLIQRLRERDEAQLDRMWKRMLKSIEADMASKDPDVRRHARAQTLKALVVGDPAVTKIEPPDASRGDFTFEELLITLRRGESKSGS